LAAALSSPRFGSLENKPAAVFTTIKTTYKPLMAKRIK
jgi:hypothetical protein